MPTTIVISKSDKPDKKLKAQINNKTIHFGQQGASDYTIHKDTDRRQRYIDRHRKHEDWTKSGIDTAGFYSKNILWNRLTINQSIADLNSKYKDIKFKLKN